MSAGEEDTETAPLLQRNDSPRAQRRQSYSDIEVRGRMIARLVPLLFVEAPLVALMIIISLRDPRDGYETGVPGVLTIVLVAFSILVTAGKLLVPNTLRLREKLCFCGPLYHLLAFLFMLLAALALFFSNIHFGTGGPRYDARANLAAAFALLDFFIHFGRFLYWLA